MLFFVPTYIHTFDPFSSNCFSPEYAHIWENKSRKNLTRWILLCYFYYERTQLNWFYFTLHDGTDNVSTAMTTDNLHKRPDNTMHYNRENWVELAIQESTFSFFSRIPSISRLSLLSHFRQMFMDSIFFLLVHIFSLPTFRKHWFIVEIMSFHFAKEFRPGMCFEENGRANGTRLYLDSHFRNM